MALLLAFDGGGYEPVTRAQIGILIWALIALGLALGLLPRSRPSTPTWVALGGLVALTALTGLALSWTESDERTTAELARVLQYGGIVLLAYLALNRNTWQGAAAGFGAAALIVPVASVASRLFPDAIPDDAANLLNTDRLSYPLDYWNGVACWGAMAVAAAICWSAHAEKVVLRSLALAAIPFASLSVYLTYSRAGAIAVPLAVIAAVALSRHRWTAAFNACVAALGSAAVILVARGQDEIARATGNAGAGTVLLVLIAAALVSAAAAVLTSSTGTDRLRMPRQPARLAVAAVTAAAVLAAVALQGPLERSWDEFRGERAIATGSDPTARLGTLGGKRYVAWTSALDAFDTDPARGIGPGSYEFFWSRQGEDPEFIRDAHSLYLEELAELGLPGIAALLTALGGLLAAALAARGRNRRPRDAGGVAALTSAYIIFLFYAGVDWMWELGAIGALALGGAAVAGAAGLERRRGMRLTPFARGVAAMGALVMVAAQVPTLSSTERVRAADAALRDGELKRAEELASDAVRAEPWAASPYATRALVAERVGDLDQARLDLRSAIKRERTNWRHHLLLARVEARAGNRERAEMELESARRLAPRSYLLVDRSPYVLEIERLLSGGD